MIDVGGAKHWQGELGKLAPQVIKVNGHHYERTEFGGSWKSFDPVQRAKDEQEAKQAYEKRMAELKLNTEWYSMTEKQREDVGSKLFPTLATPEGGWTREKLVEAGLFSNIDLSKPQDAASFWSAKRDGTERIKVKMEPNSVLSEQRIIDAFSGNVGNYPNLPEPSYVYAGAEAKMPTTGVDPLADIRKFTNLAKSGGYFQENKELNDFLTQLGREAKAEETKRTPKSVEAAKAEALKQKIAATETMPSSGGRPSLKRGLSSSPKNTLRIGGVADTDETSVNIPT